MNKTLSTLLTTAIVTGLFASQAAKAQAANEEKGATDPAAVEKQKCKTAHPTADAKQAGEDKDKHSCQGKAGCGNKGAKKKAKKTESK